VVVSQFMRNTNVAEPAIAKAAIHRDARHAHGVEAKAPHVTDAEAAA
jgi:hypothetical protein